MDSFFHSIIKVAVFCCVYMYVCECVCINVCDMEHMWG